MNLTYNNLDEVLKNVKGDLTNGDLVDDFEKCLNQYIEINKNEDDKSQKILEDIMDDFEFIESIISFVNNKYDLELSEEIEEGPSEELYRYILYTIEGISREKIQTLK